MEEIMDSLHALILSRKVLYLRISNTPAWVVATASTYSRLQGCIPLTIYQGRWSVLRRDLEILPMERRFGMALAAWDAIDGGKPQSAKTLQARNGRG